MAPYAASAASATEAANAPARSEAVVAARRNNALDGRDALAAGPGKRRAEPTADARSAASAVEKAKRHRRGAADGPVAGERRRESARGGRPGLEHLDHELEDVRGDRPVLRVF